MMFCIRFWGVRGSIPTPGASTVLVGGNTSCVEIRCGKQLIILDGGTGLRLLGNNLIAKQPITASIFFSHVHWDHVQGFPFFLPALLSGNHFDLFGGEALSETLAETLEGQMDFPNFPISLSDMNANINFHKLTDGEKISLGNDVFVQCLLLNHPNDAYGYRIEYNNQSIAFCPDVEYGHERDNHIFELAQNVDLLIYDAQYTPQEYYGTNSSPSKKGWGHSTYVQAAQIAKTSNVKKLILFHHDPMHNDEAIADKERRCRELFTNCEAAREGLIIEL